MGNATNRPNHVDFSNLDKVLDNPLAKKRKAKESSDSLGEFMFSLSNFIAYAGELREDELANLTKSLQNWMIRRNFTTCLVPVDIGDIFFADLGMTYKLESSYPHPVVVLEKVGNLLLVVPTTTSNDIVNSAYHPESNKTGIKYFRKVEKDEDGFDETCAILLSNASTINAGRLLKKQSCMKNINDDKSIFKEIKNSIFQFFMPREFRKYEKLQEEHNKLKEDYNVLKKKSEESLDEVSNALIELDRIDRLNKKNIQKSG
ncbi:hypothetical protein PP175_03830 [Aneurinibacillus sp. Ricciae_BoGa-3]|uniref:hypothetical protein n=1 Tax=Aneurinibacillus sp. Ricciae_BoGa-3 TaxID=3022697 RepID=UPI00233F8C19|nr:hypothetical protein [Aneurinibacillus sp. Ricciae_BoGa-3]WCK55127.1 hypothetical protein PP175_03830 [Aneurinibacillus sp. Ricciae_BoGa-3]